MRALVVVSVLASTACVSMPRAAEGQHLNSDGVRNRAAFDFSCPADQIEVVDLDGRNLSFGATGCGKKASYVWKGSTVVLNSPIVSIE